MNNILMCWSAAADDEETRDEGDKKPGRVLSV